MTKTHKDIHDEGRSGSKWLIKFRGEDSRFFQSTGRNRFETDNFLPGYRGDLKNGLKKALWSTEGSECSIAEGNRTENIEDSSGDSRNFHGPNESTLSDTNSINNEIDGTSIADKEVKVEPSSSVNYRKIAHLFDAAKIAGAHRYSTYLCRNGYGNLMIVTDQHRGDAPENAVTWFTSIGVPVVFASDGLESIVSALNRNKIGVLYSQTALADRWVYNHMDLLKSGGRKWVLMDQGRWLQAWRRNSLLYQNYFQAVMNAVDRIVIPCPRHQTEMLEQHGITQKTKEAIYGVADMQEKLDFCSRFEHGIPSRDDKKVVFCLFARMIAEKGPAIAVRFTKLLNEDNFGAHLVLVGTGPEWDRLSNEKPCNVTFIEVVSNPQILKDCFDVGIHPSTYDGETGPMTPPEISVMRKPTLATDNANTAEYLGDYHLTVPWQNEHGCVRTDESIAQDMFSRAKLLFYDDNKNPNWDRIRQLGEKCYYHQQKCCTLNGVLNPYKNGVLSFD